MKTGANPGVANRRECCAQFRRRGQARAGRKKRVQACCRSARPEALTRRIATTRWVRHCTFTLHAHTVSHN